MFIVDAINAQFRSSKNGDPETLSVHDNLNNDTDSSIFYSALAAESEFDQSATVPPRMSELRTPRADRRTESVSDLLRESVATSAKVRQDSVIFEDPAGSLRQPATRCDKYRLGPVAIYCFRRRLDCFIFAALAASLVSLILSFVLPAVIQEQLKAGVTSALVLESTNSPSYASWQTNAGDPTQPVIHYEV
jgi:hypothetical protein